MQAGSSCETTWNPFSPGPDVEQENVRVQLARRRDRLAAARAQPDDRDIRPPVEQLREVVTRQRPVVHHQDAKRSGGGAGHATGTAAARGSALLETAGMTTIASAPL